MINFSRNNPYTQSSSGPGACEYIGSHLSALLWPSLCQAVLTHGVYLSPCSWCASRIPEANRAKRPGPPCACPDSSAHRHTQRTDLRPQLTPQPALSTPDQLYTCTPSPPSAAVPHPPQNPIGLPPLSASERGRA